MVALAVLACSALADTITLNDGRVFASAVVSSQTPTHVTIKHAGGFSQVNKAALPRELLAKYPIDEAAAAAKVKREAEQLEERRKAAEAKALEARQLRESRYAEQQKYEAANPKKYEVEFVVNASVPTADVFIVGGAATAADQRTIYLNPLGEWKRTLAAESGQWFYISSKLPKKASELIIMIKVDGEIVEKLTLTGTNPQGCISYALPGVPRDDALVKAQQASVQMQPVNSGDGRTGAMQAIVLDYRLDGEYLRAQRDAQDRADQAAVAAARLAIERAKKNGDDPYKLPVSEELVKAFHGDRDALDAWRKKLIEPSPLDIMRAEDEAQQKKFAEEYRKRAAAAKTN